MTVQQDPQIKSVAKGAFEQTEKLDALALLEQIEERVKLPMPATRRRRFWLAWMLWAIFGAAVTWSGAPQGAALAMASILTAPFWLLFLVWPVLWMRDRLRARQLWAQDVRLIIDEPPEGQGEAVALPVIVGRDQSLMVPLTGWCTVFPEISREDLTRWGAEILPAEKLPGVALEVMSAEALVAELAKKLPKTPATAAAQRWVECLKRAIEGKF